jgi:hypothetical protein
MHLQAGCQPADSLDNKIFFIVGMRAYRNKEPTSWILFSVRKRKKSSRLGALLEQLD